MKTINHLAEQQVIRHESHLKHIDELLQRVDKGVTESNESSKYYSELNDIRQQREKLVNHISELKKNTREEWQEDKIEDVGPMVIWEAVAKRLEKLVERIEHKLNVS